jgi:hypothetical protein
VWLLLTLLRFGKEAWRLAWNGPQIAGISLSFYVAVPILLAWFIVIEQVRQAMKLDFPPKSAGRNEPAV